MQSKKEKPAIKKIFISLILFKLGGILLILLTLVFCSSRSVDENTDMSLLTIERIFSSNEFSSERFGPARWLEDESGYTVLEHSGDGAGSPDIVRYDPEKGQHEVLIPSARLTPPDESHPVQITDYKWSPDGKRLLVFTKTRRVFHKTFGDYWILNLNDWKMHKLGGNAKPSTLMLATFSPDGRKIGYVCENNIFVEDLVNHKIVQLTMDGSDTILNGTFDWVRQEESPTRNGFRWSPDSKLIAYWQLDTEKVPTFYMINNTDSLYPRIISYKYPKPGETNAASRIGVVSASGGKTRWFQVPGDPSNNYIQQMDWAGNSNEVVFQHLNRLQNKNEVMLGDARTGQVRTIMTDSDPKWLDLFTGMRWLDNGKNFTWVSERDGWRHVYIVSRSGDEMKLITPGEFDVICIDAFLCIQSIDEKGGWMYYIASPNNPRQRYLYRVPLDGSGKAERITPKGQDGTHSYQISPCSRWAFHTYSTFNTPPVTNLVTLPEHKEVRMLVDNKKLCEKINSLKRSPAEFFRIDIGDGVLLDAWCMKPHDFNPKKKYPVLFFVYGEPMGSTVMDNWGESRYLWHLMLTQHGYIVMSVDNRGTRVPRGRAWRKIIYRQVGILASADQAAATRAIIKRWDYVDPTRIGIWGGSGGGAMTLNAIFRYSDLYRTGMALKAPTNQRFYDTIYQERYMGLPEDNKEGYEKGSPVNFAHQLKGNLLYIHGTGDDNVHYQNAEVLINELIKHNKHFTMMAYPNRSHSLSEGKNTTRHIYELLTRYLKENLPTGPR